MFLKEKVKIFKIIDLALELNELFFQNFIKFYSVCPNVSRRRLIEFRFKNGSYGLKLVWIINNGQKMLVFE